MVLTRKLSKSGRSERQIWTQNQKLQVVTTYLALGSVVETALVTGVPLKTIEAWKTSAWWKEFALKLQAEDVQQLDSNLKRIVEKSLKAVEDRLDNGDAMYDQKTGKVARIPVKANVALKISTELLTKRDKITEAPKKEEVEKTIDARLLKLAEEFSNFAKEQRQRTIDVPAVEIVNDQA